MINSTISKKQLKDYIGNDEMQKAFAHLEKKGCDIKDIKARYEKRKAREQELVKTKQQYSALEYQKETEEFTNDNRMLLNMIDEVFK